MMGNLLSILLCFVGGPQFITFDACLAFDALLFFGDDGGVGMSPVAGGGGSRSVKSGARGPHTEAPGDPTVVSMVTYIWMESTPSPTRCGSSPERWWCVSAVRGQPVRQGGTNVDRERNNGSQDTISISSLDS
jgi:hypothetical protein